MRPAIWVVAVMLLAAPAAAQPADRLVDAMVITHAILQGLDIHSTTAVLAQGGREQNPIVRPIAGHLPAFIAVKAAVTLGVAVFAKEAKRRHRVAALVVVIGLNVLYAVVVRHNYRQLRAN